MRIGLDLDGVCYRYESTARYMIRRRMVKRGAVPPSELWEASQSWDWIKLHAEPEDWKWLWDRDGAIKDGVFRYGHIVEGAIEGAQALTEIGDVTVITARPKGAVHDTLDWLELMFDKVPLAGVIIQSDGQKKSEVLPTPDVYIDDAKHNFDDLLDNTGACVVQYVQPWNSDYVPRSALHSTRLFPARDWREIVRTVRALKEAGVK